MTRRMERVVVVGADAPAWMSAAAIHASVGGAGVRVRVIELPSMLRPGDVYSALPALAGFHHRLGIDESLLFKFCDALPVTGQRFSNWSGATSRFIQGYDRLPPAGGADVGFLQVWIKGRQQGLRTPLENFSPAAVTARTGRVPVPAEGSGLQATFGYNINAASYSALLKQFVTNGGVEWKSSNLAAVEIEENRIAAIILDDGERIEADLFVDASGPQATLIGRMPDAEFQSWPGPSLCDRLMVASANRLQPYPAYSQISAFRQGWIGLFPLQNRTAVVAAFDSGQISDKQLLDDLPVLANLPIIGEAVVSRLAQGMRKRNWVGNCVAVGESAFSLEPIDGVQLHVTHSCISHFMSLFPVEAGEFPQAELYDEIIGRVAVNLRDFQLAHYKLNRRFDEPLWDYCRDATVPTTLQRKLDVFSARGRVPLYDDETFQEHGWETLFVGHQLIPESYDPRVDAAPEQELIAQVQRRLQNVLAFAEAMPSVEEFMASVGVTPAGVPETTS